MRLLVQIINIHQKKKQSINQSNKVNTKSENDPKIVPGHIEQNFSFFILL